MNWYAKYCKPYLDFGFAVLILFWLAPLMFLIAATILITDKQSPIFRQQRIGANGAYFAIYKFRTMRSTPDGAALTLPQDDRVTWFGALLRHTSLDELPQLLNIVKGEMSFVGPRPEILANKALYPQGFDQRLSALPGLTGLAQVEGRNRLSFREVLAYDLRYIREMSLLTDLRILSKTIIMVIGGHGAY